MEEIKIKNNFKKNSIFKKAKSNFIISKDKPQISDAEYDKLKKELLELEQKNPYLKKIASVDKIIGAPPSNKFKKFNHLHPMLSLSNAFNKNDMENFIKKIKNFLNLKKSY